ncbi:MAG: hypothetical protein JNJ60_03195 [Rhodocyclaceae bacterium]|nr:hypothetical protein [Rhodocyclaceae bacterium]
MQLDLFLDTRAVVLNNRTITALGAHDLARARSALDELRREAPEYDSLPALQTLIDAYASWRLPPPDAAAHAACAAWVARVVEPAARLGMGDAGRGFAAHFRRELALAARNLPFDAGYPTAHAAYAWLKGGDYAQAETAVLAVPEWWRHADLLYWVSLARHRLRGLPAARPTLFALAWRAPQRLEALVSELADDLLTRDWRAALRDRAWENTEAGQVAAWFPAWYLVEHSATSRELDPALAPDTPPARAACLVQHILDAEKPGDLRALAQQRDKLRALHAGLFGFYMDKRRTRLI